MRALRVVLHGPLGRAEVLDRYVEFVAVRCRPNTVSATGSIDGHRETLERVAQRIAADGSGCQEASTTVP